MREIEGRFTRDDESRLAAELPAVVAMVDWGTNRARV